MASGVEFDEDKFSYTPPKGAQPVGASPSFPAGSSGYSSAPKGMSGWLIAHGLAKSEKSAQVMMVFLVLVNIVITVLVVKYFIL